MMMTCSVHSCVSPRCYRSAWARGRARVILPHSFMGSSDQSLQSFTLSHTLLLSIHSPFLQRNFLGPSHFVTGGDTNVNVVRRPPLNQTTSQYDSRLKQAPSTDSHNKYPSCAVMMKRSNISWHASGMLYFFSFDFMLIETLLLHHRRRGLRVKYSKIWL